MANNKRGQNEESRKNLLKGRKFSKENQPAPEAKSAGKLKRKTMREMLDYLLEKEVTNKQGETATTREAITVALVKQALSGNVKAWEVIRDSIGEKPTDKQELSGNIGNLSIVVTKEEE